jgi:calpain-15
MLGDCYFLSAISAIAENEDRIKRIFLQRVVTPSSAYCVALCINGMWEEVVIDDFFPCQPKSKLPAFNTSKKNEI